MVLFVGYDICSRCQNAIEMKFDYILFTKVIKVIHEINLQLNVDYVYNVDEPPISKMICIILSWQNSTNN